MDGQRVRTGGKRVQPDVIPIVDGRRVDPGRQSPEWSASVRKQVVLRQRHGKNLRARAVNALDGLAVNAHGQRCKAVDEARRLVAVYRRGYRRRILTARVRRVERDKVGHREEQAHVCRDRAVSRRSGRVERAGEEPVRSLLPDHAAFAAPDRQAG